MRLTAAVLSLALAACTASAEGTLQPAVYRVIKSQDGNNAGERSIRGLLKRQYCNSGYGLCKTGGCCPIGGQCCNDGELRYENIATARC